MNAVEIEEAVSKLAETPFNGEVFAFAFLEAFGNKQTTLKRLRSGNTNQSDIDGVLQRNNIHIKTCPTGQVTETLTALRESPLTARQKAKFILATDGETIAAENLADDVPPLACEYKDLPNHFGFFLPLAGITTVRQISENAFDIRATGRLNRLYVELLKTNPEWDTEARREDLNHFFARLIFCFFAEDTGIFMSGRLFTSTVEQMTERDGSNTHEVLAELFRAMNTKQSEREQANIKSWAISFPYVNGSLYSGSTETPRFSQIARSYLIFVGGLDWKQINPDIFGSMIQAVADDEERGALGMHYTSVPNILKVLNPLLLDDLRAQLADATGDESLAYAAGYDRAAPATPSNPQHGNPQRKPGPSNPQRKQGNLRKLLNLRNRLARIRVFDPACGSGNFLVIAYKEMRAIEAEINRRRGESDRPSDIPPTNFRGIELRHFAAEIARLALVIAKFQCDSIYRGELLARAEFLPLEKANWITCGNALLLDWVNIWPVKRTGIKVRANDLFNTPLDQAEIDFENTGDETYICGNPPYKGGTEQTREQKADMAAVFSDQSNSWKSLDYVCGWFFKFANYATHVPSACAFVSTNSIAQGEQVARLWPLILDRGLSITFAHTSFKWSNLAAHNAGVTVVIVGLGKKLAKAILFQNSDQPTPSRREVDNICPYLVPHENVLVSPLTDASSNVAEIVNGNKPADGGNLMLNFAEAESILRDDKHASRFIRRYVGAAESIQGILRYCLWISDEDAAEANRIAAISRRIADVKEMREQSPKALTKKGSLTPYAFQQVRQTGNEIPIVIPSHSSESRSHLPVSLYPRGTIISNSAFAIFDAHLWNLAILASRIHLVWIAAVCGKIKTDYRYSSTLGWNTFSVPPLSDQNQADLTRCAEEILLAREAHFPATIADMYDPDRMDTEFPDLRAAHDRNDETLERIYIGRRFENDTERLEKLFEMYTQMSAKPPSRNPQRKRGSVSRD